MLLTEAGNPTSRVTSVRFTYNGIKRIVDNIDYDGKLIVGFEMRKSGKFSYKIKKYKVLEVSDLEFIDPPHRKGPSIGRPTR